MNISELFIRRPVMTSLVMAGFLLAGVFGYFRLDRALNRNASAPAE